jgi:hypothetical protein
MYANVTAYTLLTFGSMPGCNEKGNWLPVENSEGHYALKPSRMQHFLPIQMDYPDLIHS